MKNVIWAICAAASIAAPSRAQDYGSGAACSEVPLRCADAIAQGYIAENTAAIAEGEVWAARNKVLAGLARMWARAGNGTQVLVLIDSMDDDTIRLATRLYAARWLVDAAGDEMLDEAQQQMAMLAQPSGEILAALAASEAARGNQSLAQEALAKAVVALQATSPSSARDLRIAIAKAHIAGGAYGAAMEVMASISGEPPEMQVVRHSFYADLVHTRVRAGQVEAAIQMVDAIDNDFVRVAALANLTVALLEGGQYERAQVAFQNAMSEAKNYAGTEYHAELLATLTGPAYLLLGNEAHAKLQQQALREMRDTPYDTIYLNDLAILVQSLISVDELVEAHKLIPEIEQAAAPFTTRNNQYGYNGTIAMLLLKMEDIPAAFAVLNREGDAQYKQIMLLRLLDNLPQRVTPVYSPGAYYYH